ncbi:hypothetical protein HanRHA438_Chr03g0124841 [Helianthus annuus]|uniref:Uncharacterized protein n=1 Tax=Helianthus annuus TaxID=4232 RepID=A0A251V7L7_HELAN|nr:hypothetical protein HanXRQr2_Chr03g0112861 [Helianthus annuus]KAJ0935908.1 hypothetical protein HanRHA438_Chr03g0124841 [Helianthus annuus]KAJ0943832.1 hypothetical protein HanPSC8_Chr03g0109261 [Helianthus annuus]
MSDFMLFRYFFIFCNCITTEKGLFSNFWTRSTQTTITTINISTVFHTIRNKRWQRHMRRRP